MSLNINSRAASFTAENTHGKINPCQRMPEVDADGDLYGENGERMPYYPARPRQQRSYELVWDQNAWRFSRADASDASNTTQTQGRDPCAQLSRRMTLSIKIIGAAAIALLASASTCASAEENSTRMASEQHACGVVLGLDPSGRRYDTCIRSLDRSLSEWDQAQMVQTDRRACSDKGLKPGTPAFALCVVNAEQSPPNIGGYGTIAPAR
jgi:hypothetical protein